MRHRLIRNLFTEMLKASRLEKMALIIPFIVLIFDAEIFYFAWLYKEKNIMIASGFVLFLSILEIFAVMKEIHEHVSRFRRREILEEKIRKIMKGMERPTVRKIVDKFMALHPNEYSIKEVYHIACNLMDELRKKR